MVTDTVQENNSVIIAGRIVEECQFSHEVYGEGFYIFKVASERLSDQVDMIPITVSERLTPLENLKQGTYVEIKGQLRSYNNYNNKKNHLVLTVFARDIAFTEPVEGVQAPNQIFLNCFVCKPPVYRKTPLGREIADMLVVVNRAYKKSDYIPCIAWGRNAKFSSTLEVGTNIHIWGRVQSRVYQKNMGDQTEERVAYEVSVSKIEIVREEQKKESLQEV